MAPYYIDAGNVTAAAAFRMSDGTMLNHAVIVGNPTQGRFGELLTEWLVADVKNIVTPFADAPTLDKYKEGVKRQIDADAERARLLFVTAGSAQAGVYLAKYEEAVTIQADPNPSPAEYPLLAASIGVDGATLEEVAASVRGLNLQWRYVAGVIERVRLQSKHQIKLASNMAQVQAIKSAVVWPKP
jgi:hypothetical protein